MKNIVSVLLLTAFVLTVNAQEKDPVLLSIGGNDVKLSEFSAIFNKNNSKENVTEESIQEYLDLYVKFKLKVKEAEELGYDTLPKFIKELAGYRGQLALPYLTDKEVTDGLISEAYERMKLDVRAAHILVKVDENAKAADTLVAYKKAINIRKRILKGEDFSTIAKETSSDPSAQKNGGDLGYFSVLHMVYPFETAAYETKLGGISMPVRTKFGYHIIKVVDKRTARASIKVAHIMIKNDKKVKSTKDESKVSVDDAQLKIDEIYTKLIAGEDFAALAKQFSDDKGSANRSGELPEFNTGKMVDNFENTAYALAKDGDYSEPIKTDFGWHIIKRLELKKIKSFDELKDELKAKVARDSRSNKSKKALLQKIKDQNGFVEHIKERNDFYKIVDKKEFLAGRWDPSNAEKYNELMFGFYVEDGDKYEYTQTDFATDFSRNKYTNRGDLEMSLETEINRFYAKLLSNKAIAFKDSRLSKTNSEFRLLMQEYRDGILLFDLTDEKVWSKAVKDSVGLNAFYEKNKSSYTWPQRVEATLYICSDAIIAKKVNKLLSKKSKKPFTNEDLLKMVNIDSQLSLKIEENKYAKGDNSEVDNATWEKGMRSNINKDKAIVIVEVTDVIAPGVKQLSEIKGLITSDYQNYLEQEWVKALKAKYTVVVNKEVLNLVK
jgi:peptidyl-prolyl cis-trans isomerase SurA